MKLLTMLALLTLIIPLGAWNVAHPAPVEWRCVNLPQPNGRRLLFQSRTFGDSLGWAWYNSLGEQNHGVSPRILQTDGDSYALINIWTDYNDDIGFKFWLDIAVWDSDTVKIRLAIPDTLEVCERQ